MTLTQLEKRYPSYEITKAEGKRLYMVTPIGQETWSTLFKTLADVEQAIAIAEGDRIQKASETYYSHSLTDADPENGNYLVTCQWDWHIEEEVFTSKSEAIAYADHIWESFSNSSIVDIVYRPEESESEESDEIQDSESTVEILRANDSDPWVYVVFKDNQQTQFTIQAANDARTRWGVYEGDRLCYDIYGIDCAISYVKGRLGVCETISEPNPETISEPTENTNVSESTTPENTIDAMRIEQITAKKVTTAKNNIGRLPEFFKEYRLYIKSCLECFDSYSKPNHSSTACSWQVTLNGYKGTCYLSQSMDWEIQSANLDQFPSDVIDFFADNGIEIE